MVDMKLCQKLESTLSTRCLEHYANIVLLCGPLYYQLRTEPTGSKPVNVATAGASIVLSVSWRFATESCASNFESS
jgi:hypothetical protein